MKNLILSSVFVLIASSAAQAQEAVQWRVQDAGNGHWYRYTTNATTWSAGAANARAIGGHLATLSSAQEALFLRTLGAGTVWFGIYQNRSSAAFAEPGGGWEWVNGEDVVYTNWRVNTNGQPNEPNNLGGEDFGLMDANAITWNDGQETGPYPSFIEWSADCNNDGIVDYGQILDGTFPDANGNGVPDCCDGGGSCTPCPGDVASDGMVDGVDLAAVLSQWGTQGSGTFNADIDNSGLVDGGDLALVLGGWGPCPQ